MGRKGETTTEATKRDFFFFKKKKTYEGGKLGTSDLVNKMCVSHNYWVVLRKFLSTGGPTTGVVWKNGSRS